MKEAFSSHARSFASNTEDEGAEPETHHHRLRPLRREDSQSRSSRGLHLTGGFSWTLCILFSTLFGPAGAQEAVPTCTPADDKSHGQAWEAALIPILVISSGIVAGLTLGYMSLDMTQINVLIKTGSPRQQANARAIEPIRRDGHLLLVTLLLTNMILNETLPVIADPVLGGGLQAVIVSTALVVIFAEIIPQSVCSRYGLAIGAKMVWPTRILIFVFYPLAKPIAMLLTWLLGAHSGIIYRRSELKELITMHGDQGPHGGDLKADTITIVGATLDLQEKTVGDAMTPINDVFMLDFDNTRLDYPTLSKILRAGYSRIPVCEYLPQPDGKPKRRIKGVILVKQFILLDPEDATPLKDLPIHSIPVIPDDMPLLNILNSFQEGRSHLAIVAPRLPDALRRTHTSRSDRFKAKYESTRDKDRSLFRSLFKRDDDEKDLLHLAETGSQRELGIPSDAKSSRSSLVLPLDEENPLGLITLEDVIEELIGEPIADETDRAPDGSVALQPYLPPEALEAITKESKGSLPPPAAPSPTPSSQPVRSARSSLAQTLLGARASSPAAVSKDAPETTEKSRTAVLPSLPRLPRLTVARSRSAPGRKRDAAPTALATDVDPPAFVAEPDELDEKLATLKEGSSGSSDEGDDLESEKMIRRRSLDDRKLPTPNASAPLAAAPSPRVPQGLANAVLLERGRRQLAAHGTDLSGVNLRVVGTPTGERLAFISPPQPGAGPATSSQPASDKTGSMVKHRSTFKAPAPSSLPARPAANATMSKERSDSPGQSKGAEGNEEHTQQ